MSPKTVITMFVLATIVPAARADVDVNPVSAVMFLTDPLATPRDSLYYPSHNPFDVTVSYSDPYHPTTSRYSQVGISFDLRLLSFPGASFTATQLVLSTLGYSKVSGYEPYPLVSSMAYGTDTTAIFSVSTFFSYAGSGGALGPATLLPGAPQNQVLTFDVTNIFQTALASSTNYPYLKFWVMAPNIGASWSFTPTLRFVGVPEPSTVLLMGIGVSALGLFGLKRRDRGRVA